MIDRLVPIVIVRRVVEHAHDAIIGGFSSGNCGGGSGSASSISTASFHNCGDDLVVGGGNDCGGGASDEGWCWWDGIWSIWSIDKRKRR